MSRHWRPIVLFCAAFALYGAALGDSTLWSRDETTYADMARHMLRSGDWLTLWWDGAPWFNHPPLFYWMMALDFRLLGVTELAARLPAAFFGAAGVALTYVWGATFLSPRGATFAALAMMLNLQYWFESRMAIIDSTFLFFLSLAMLGFWRGWRGRGYLLFFAGCGLACLAKGPWGVAIPLVVVIPFALLSNPRRLREVPWGWGIPLTMAIGGTWYVLEMIRHGEVFTRTVLGYYFLGRLTLQVEQQGGPIWLYLPVLLAGFMPWSFLLPGALRDLWRRRREDEAALFVLCWIAIPLVGLSLASTKLPSYAAFVFAPCALAVGRRLDHGDVDFRRPFGMAAGLALFLTAAVRFWGETHLDLLHLEIGVLHAAEIAFGTLAAGLLIAAFGRTPSPPAWAAAGMVGCLLSLTFLFVPALEPQRNLVVLRDAVRGAVHPGDRVAFYGPGVYGILYYADVGPMMEVRDIPALRAWVDDTPGGVLITPRATLDRLPFDLRARLEVTAETPREAIVRVRQPT